MGATRECRQALLCLPMSLVRRAAAQLKEESHSVGSSSTSCCSRPGGVIWVLDWAGGRFACLFVLFEAFFSNLAQNRIGRTL